MVLKFICLMVNSHFCTIQAYLLLIEISAELYSVSFHKQHILVHFFNLCNQIIRMLGYQNILCSFPLLLIYCETAITDVIVVTSFKKRCSIVYNDGYFHFLIRNFINIINILMFRIHPPHESE